MPLLTRSCSPVTNLTFLENIVPSLTRSCSPVTNPTFSGKISCHLLQDHALLLQIHLFLTRNHVNSYKIMLYRYKIEFLQSKIVPLLIKFMFFCYKLDSVNWICYTFWCYDRKSTVQSRSDFSIFYRLLFFYYKS